ncbi:MAG: flagellar motor protein [Deltaproteobacteria bacterium]|nr:flagellar motor protein [Deltaproteobacteria bacterium]
MDILTIIGLFLGVIAVVGGQLLEGGRLSSIIQITAAVIVFGGTIGATFVNYPWSTVKLALNLVKKAVFNNKDDSREIIDQIIRFAWLVRREGLLSLEAKVKNIYDPFFKKGIQLMIDGRGADEIREIMSIEINQGEDRKFMAARVFESAGGYAPTIGILGAVLGLIHVMENLADPSKLGQGIAVAFVATVYGVGSANLFWLPLAGKLKVRIKEDSSMMELMLEGAASLASGENPLIMKERLEGFLSGADRTAVVRKRDVI